MIEDKATIPCPSCESNHDHEPWCPFYDINQPVKTGDTKESDTESNPNLMIGII